MSQLEVDKIIPQSGTTLTIGDSGDTVNFADGTNLSIDTNTLFIDSTNNRVGIANASPSVALDVTGAAKVSGDLTVNTNTFKVDSSSNTVLIGETDHAPWDTGADDLIIGGQNNGGITFHNPTQTSIYFADGTTGSDTKRGRIQYIHSDDSLRFGTSGNNANVYINNAGKLGLATSTPEGRLHIYDFSGSGGFRISRTNDILESNFHITCGSNDTFLSTYGNLRIRTEPIADGVGGTDRLYISDAGDIGIGTTAPSQKLDVVGSIEVSDGIYIGGTGSANKLDDYEEGTWTPTINVGTYTLSAAKYLKIGNKVTLWINFLKFANTTDGSNIEITGLPYNVDSGYASTVVGNVMVRNTGNPVNSIYITSGSTLVFYKSESGAFVPLKYSDLNSSSNEMYFVATYKST